MQGIPDESLFFPHACWNFPSRDLPRNFNFGSVYHHLVETMPQLEQNGDEGDLSGEEEVVPTIEIEDPFDNEENDDMLRSQTNQTRSSIF